MATGETVSESQLPRRLLAALDECWSLVDDTLDKEQNIMVTNQRNDELESRFAAALKLNSELKESLQKTNKSSSELDKKCSKLESVHIKDSDQSRLNNAQEMVNIGKEYTGIRFDYKVPENIIKGYVKNSSKMMLECFEYKLDDVKTSTVSSNLWKLIASAASNNWQDLVTGRVVDKENAKNN